MPDAIDAIYEAGAIGFPLRHVYRLHRDERAKGRLGDLRRLPPVPGLLAAFVHARMSGG